MQLRNARKHVTRNLRSGLRKLARLVHWGLYQLYGIYGHLLIAHWTMPLRLYDLLEGHMSTWEVTAGTFSPLSGSHSFACIHKCIHLFLLCMYVLPENQVGTVLRCVIVSVPVWQQVHQQQHI